MPRYDAQKTPSGGRKAISRASNIDHIESRSLPSVSLSQLPNSAEINHLPLKTVGNASVLVEDVGKAMDAHEIQTNVVRVDGQPSVDLPILKQGGDTNTISVVNGIKDAINHLADIPKQLVAKVVFDPSVFVKKAIENLLHEGGIGLLLTGLMILLFLGSMRATVAVFLSIPMAQTRLPNAPVASLKTGFDRKRMTTAECLLPAPRQQTSSALGGGNNPSSQVEVRRSFCGQGAVATYSDLRKEAPRIHAATKKTKATRRKGHGSYSRLTGVAWEHNLRWIFSQCRWRSLSHGCTCQILRS
jgi:AcrB/AcrD/AcrF family protein